MKQDEVYIGARYVPVFADDPWSDDREYEALTVVLHEGNSYTSRQYVPVGIDISNGQYWALTGNYAEIPLMSETVRGGAKVGAGLTVTNGALELDGSGDIATAVSDWLDAHPEATTTVQDGSITNVKLVQNGGILSEVEDIRTGYDGTSYNSAGYAVRNNDSRMYNFIDALVGHSIFNETDFERGSVTTNGTNSTYREKVRFRSIGFLSFPYDITITKVGTGTPGPRFFYAYYSGGEIVLSETLTTVTIPANTLFRICFDARYGQSSDLPTLDQDEVLSLYTITPNLNLSELDSDVTNLKEDVGEISNNYIPSYYFENDYLQNKTFNAQNASCVNGVSFGFITDIHINSNSLNSMKLARHIADNTSSLPFMICGGDIPTTQVGSLNGLKIQAMKWQKMMSEFNHHKVYTCRGNHDYLGKDSENVSINCDYGTQRSFITGYLMDNITTANENSFAYYFDITDKKARFIVIDDYSISCRPTFGGYVGITPEEFHWFTDVALPVNDYHVIVITHQQLFGDNLPSALNLLRNIINAFTTKTSIQGSWGATVINKDFSNYTSEMVCAISGHVHYDTYDDTENDFLSIVTTCDACYATDGYERVMGTTNEGAFDVMAIDFDNKTIQCTRIGAGSDRQFNY